MTELFAKELCMSKKSPKLLFAALTLTGFVACTDSGAGERTVTGTIPAALTSLVKTVRAVTVNGLAINAQVVSGKFQLAVPVARTVLVFVDGNNNVIANLRFAGSGGGALQTTIPAGAAGDTLSLGAISIAGKTAASEVNPLSEIDCDDDGTADLDDADDDNDGTADASDSDDDGNSTADSAEDLDTDDDGDCDMADADDDNDGVADSSDSDDDGDGTEDASEHDGDHDGVDDSADADDDNDGAADADDSDDDGDGVSDDADEDHA